MLELMLVVTMLEGAQIEATGIECRFPQMSEEHRVIHLKLDPMPSLKDQPGLYRVMMNLNGKMKMKAQAQPIETTGHRDVLVLARSKSETIYTLGMRDDGSAALTMRRNDEVAPARIGSCRGHEALMNAWVPS